MALAGEGVMRLWLFFLWAFFMGGVLLSAPGSVWTFLARCVLGLCVGLVLQRYGRDILLWLAESLVCHDPLCLRCRMRSLDLRRMELEIMEKAQAMNHETGERAH